MDCLFPRGLCRNCICGLLGNGHDREVYTSAFGEEIGYSRFIVSKRLAL